MKFVQLSANLVIFMLLSFSTEVRHSSPAPSNSFDSLLLFSICSMALPKDMPISNNRKVVKWWPCKK